jgi:hypothetical protein
MGSSSLRGIGASLLATLSLILPGFDGGTVRAGYIYVSTSPHTLPSTGEGSLEPAVDPGVANPPERSLESARPKVVLQFQSADEPAMPHRRERPLPIGSQPAGEVQTGQSPDQGGEPAAPLQRERVLPNGSQSGGEAQNYRSLTERGQSQVGAEFLPAGGVPAPEFAGLCRLQNARCGPPPFIPPALPPPRVLS